MKVGDLRALLEAHGLAPQGRFGQNFLIDPALLAAIPQDAGVQVGEAVLEVGPGVGSLSRSLLDAGARLCAVEIDHGLAALLRQRFSTDMTEGRFQLVEGDALASHERFHPEVEAWWAEQATPPRLVANLPYAISGPFLARLPGRPMLGATLLLQREVAQKAAGPGSQEEWSPLAIRLALAFHTKLGRKLPPEVFWPRPSIQSAFLHLEPKADALAPDQEARLAAVLKTAYAQRRKRVLGRLRASQAGDWADALTALGVEEGTRPGALTPEIWREALKRLS
jgi:16S rRNA (adenine1518-N6/adenine1519-N6)-dimethyltransferase